MILGFWKKKFLAARLTATYVGILMNKICVFGQHSNHISILDQKPVQRVC